MTTFGQSLVVLSEQATCRERVSERCSSRLRSVLLPNVESGFSQVAAVVGVLAV